MKILIFLSMFLFSGCAVFVAKPEVTLKNVKLAGLDSRDMELDFYFSVKNPNSFDLKLEDYSYDVKILSLPLANGSSKTSFDFYANSTNDLLIPVKIHAELTIGRGIGSMTVPVTKSGVFAMPAKLYPSNIGKKIGDFLKGLER
jgi:LEA14-like dessication related protein